MERQQTATGTKFTLGRVGFGRSATAIFFVMFGAFFAGIPMIMLVAIWVLGGNQMSLLAKLGSTAFVSIFIVIGLAFLSAGLLELLGAHVVIFDGRELRAGKQLGPIRWFRKRSLGDSGAFAVRPASSTRDALAGVHLVVITDPFGSNEFIVARAVESEARQLAETLAQETGLRLEANANAASVEDVEAVLERHDESLAKRESDYELAVAPGDVHWKVFLPIAVALDAIILTVIGVVFVVNGKLPVIVMIVGGMFFSVVSLILVFAVMGAMAASKLGPPVVRLSVHPVLLGEPFEMTLEQPVKSAGRHEGVTATLLMKETAEYQRGTNRYTVTHETFKQKVEVVPAGPLSPGQSLTGTASFEIPTAAMHTFEAKNNKILWILKVQTVLKGWPDFRRSFELRVLPRAFVDSDGK